MNFNLADLPKNIGSTDKWARIGFGALLVLLAGTGIIGAWGLIGVIPLATGLLGHCPVYKVMGMNTCGNDQKPAT